LSRHIIGQQQKHQTNTKNPTKMNVYREIKDNKNKLKQNKKND
jgi:hypothetical protein